MEKEPEVIQLTLKFQGQNWTYFRKASSFKGPGFSTDCQTS